MSTFPPPRVMFTFPHPAEFVPIDPVSEHVLFVQNLIIELSRPLTTPYFNEGMRGADPIKFIGDFDNMLKAIHSAVRQSGVYAQLHAIAVASLAQSPECKSKDIRTAHEAIENLYKDVCVQINEDQELYKTLRDIVKSIVPLSHLDNN